MLTVFVLFAPCVCGHVPSLSVLSLSLSLSVRLSLARLLSLSLLPVRSGGVSDTALLIPEP
jgi:hypothetical protein